MYAPATPAYAALTPDTRKACRRWFTPKAAAIAGSSALARRALPT